MSSKADQNKATAIEFFDALAAVDATAAAKHLTPDYVLEVPGTSVLSGVRSGPEIGNILEFVKFVLPHGVRLQRLLMIAEGDYVACQSSGTGTTLDGESYNNEYFYLITFRDGKIARLTEYMDTRLVDERLGPRYREWMSKAKSA